ncbi:hypothetical protein QVD17_19570 [Tagetes erecta]|uniref:Uncharacterized protein n=1 Tax=Tagetes erecta TaxID=13708 RepID=A0AAD8NWL3_TARER|nr:hypothetical protein QVD17_19570 [Tagetes erecta]
MDATIFDDAVQAMVGISCAELLMQSSNVDLLTISEAVAKIIGQPTKFSTQVQKNNRTSALHGTIKRVTMPVTHSFTRTPAIPMPATSQSTATQSGSPSRSSAKRPLDFNQGGSKTSTSKTTVATSPITPAPTKQPPHNNEGKINKLNNNMTYANTSFNKHAGTVAAKAKKKRSE